MNRITVISNNISLGNFKEEHGLSLLIEFDNRKILLDTGATDSFIYNFKKLKIDNIDALVLSHGHNDHCGNICYIKNNFPGLTVLTHPQVSDNRFSIHPDRTPMVKNIGINKENLECLNKLNIKYNRKYSKISENIYLTGEIPRLSGEDSGGPFFFDVEGNKKDIIIDDQAIGLISNNGLIIVTGCCHSGIENSIEYIKKITGINNVLGVVGGFHLSKASKERVFRSIQYLSSLDLSFAYPGHCTGENIIELFKSNLNIKISSLKSGITINF